MAQNRMPFIAKVETYRKEWIHRLAGGAQIYSNKSPLGPDAQVQIMVPINPSTGQNKHDAKAYLKAIARTRTNNGGKWLYPVGEFADELTNGLKSFLLDYLAVALNESQFELNEGEAN